VFQNKRYLKAASAAVLFSACLCAAPAAQATTVVFDSGRMDHARKVNIEGIGDVSAAPMLFTGNYGGEAFTDLVAFCVDVYHRISRRDYDPDLTYNDEVPLTTDSNFVGATLLTSGQISQVGRLANYGTLAFYNAPAGNAAQRNARWDELAAVQGAIWQVVSGRNVVSTNLALDARIDALSSAGYAGFFNASLGTPGAGFTFLTPATYPDRRGTQGMVIGTVPEPAAWALMIGGFAAAGMMLRARRRLGLV
jgi:hypothetical protein